MKITEILSKYPAEHIYAMTSALTRVTSQKELLKVASKSKHGMIRAILVPEGVYAFPGELGSHSVAACILGYEGREDPRVEKLVFTGEGKEIFQGYEFDLWERHRDCSCG